MGGRKFKLSQRKNEERRKQKTKSDELVEATKEDMSLTVTLPLTLYVEGNVDSQDILYSRLTAVTLPESWVIAAKKPLTLAKLRLHHNSQLPKVDVSMTLGVQDQLTWTLVVSSSQVNTPLNPMFRDVASRLTSASAVVSLLSLLNSAKICVGNPDRKFMELWHQRSLTLHGSTGNKCAFLDDLSLPSVSTVRHNNCHMLLPCDKQGIRCVECITYRTTLTIQSTRMQASVKRNDFTPSSHVNHRFQPLPTLISRLSQLHQQCRTLSKQVQRLQAKIAETVQVNGVTLDEQSNDDLKQIMTSPQCKTVFEDLPEDSFQKIFWQQQMEAFKKNPRSMRWHPLMIRWCLYLRHRSSGAYEALRDSGCVKLPSQRTLRDYTHYVQASTGFSSEVDQMLVDAVKIDSCPEREKHTILLLDEMHIRQDLVFDKHTGAMIGFCNLGDINDHLLQFEQSLCDSNPSSPKLAKTMMVFMVRGLFSKLQFPYVQFPCADLSGDLLYEPFWEAVCRIETCGLKVWGATLDGNSVNRRLIKLHQQSEDITYKVDNPFTEEDRPFFFFSDPPHLIKTTRNCWLSKSRNLYNNGLSISWGHLRNLYEQDTAPGVGIRMLPKLKYEHISLTSFSKMRVDLAAQVLSESISKALKLTGGDGASETAKFTEYMDKFFDCLNVSNYVDGIHKRKKFRMPYTSSSDMRIEWLEKTFLPYLDMWENWVKSVKGVTKTEQSNMMLSAETRLGLKITCKSFIELVRHLFKVPGVQSFLSQRLCQDPLENFFGCQRQRGGVHDNPNVHEFTKNTQALRVINSFCKGSLRGNCRGGNSEQRESDKENEPLPKRRRQRSTSKPLGMF